MDGFVADRNGSVGRLYPDLEDLRGTAYMNAAIEETGAVLMGRKTFEMEDPDSYVGEYEFQVPIFMLTREPPRVQPMQDEHLTFTFRDRRSRGCDRAGSRSRGGQGRHGGWWRQRRPAAPACRSGRRASDRHHAGVVGSGLPFFGNADLEGVQLAKTGVQEVGARTSLRFRVE